MTQEAIAAIATAALAPEAAAAPLAPARAGFSLHDVARFEAAMAGPERAAPASASGLAEFANAPAMRDFFVPLDKINSATERFMVASERLHADPDVGPGAMLMTMVGVQKFMLECQLTSSVANRASDGIQELFRQQS